MPSKTAVTELIRKKKETARGKKRKRDNAKKGTINYQTAFDTPPVDADKQKNKRVS